jgi:drug/metabolite transporter (DMT)-like permease
MILLMAGITWNYKNILFISLAFIGVLLLNYSHYDGRKKSKEDSSKDSSEDLSKDSSEDLSKDSSEDLSKDSSKKITIGILYILLAAFTEALMYFYVRRIKTDNNWNQMFFSSYLGAFLLSVFLFIKKNKDKNDDNKELFANNLSKMTLLNIFIGSMGYYLRFYATYRLDPLFYSMLSYFGIFMAFIYGIIFNKEKITFSKIIGAACIIISNISLYIFTKV